MTPEEHNNNLKPHLKRVITKKVTYSEKDAKRNKAIMMHVLENLVTAMKATSPLFKELYQRTVYTGSFYDGLRITEANEFDLNLVLRLPIPAEDIEIICSTIPDFVRYHLNRNLEEIYGNHPKWTPELYQRFKTLFEDNYLMRDKVQSWFQGVINRAWENFEKPKNVSSVRLQQNGPAMTLIIKLSRTKKIDVDLVPVFDGSAYSMPAEFKKSRRFGVLGSEAQASVLVPKPLKNEQLLLTDARICWRISFPEAEKKLLENMNCAKPLIKLFKLLRDIEKWPIPSYFIKTLYLLELDKNARPGYWHERHLGTRFMEMLKQFKRAVELKNISYYFNREANLLSQLDDSTAQNIANRLGKITTKIEAQPSFVLSVYKII